MSMSSWIVGIMVFSGGVIGSICGVKERMKHDPELREKGLLRALFSR